nr:immunoglobulin heavy chain junction region [Mus musculus]
CARHEATRLYSNYLYYFDYW